MYTVRGGLCKPEYSCLVSEFGTILKNLANPYKTRSFGSTFVLGHEIGHSLGMRHDDYLGCDKVYIAHCALSLDSLMHPTTIYTVTYQNVTNLLYNMNPLKFLWFF